MGLNTASPTQILLWPPNRNVWEVVATGKRKILVKRDLRADGTEAWLRLYRGRTCREGGGAATVWQHEVARRKASTYTQMHSPSSGKMEREIVRHSLVPVSDTMKELCFDFSHVTCVLYLSHIHTHMCKLFCQKKLPSCLEHVPSYPSILMNDWSGGAQVI